MLTDATHGKPLLRISAVSISIAGTKLLTTLAKRLSFREERTCDVMLD